MNKKIILLGLAGCLSSTLYASEVQYGTGTFEMSGGFIGLDKTISTDISTYSLVEQHKNIFSSSLFYKYNFTWYDSDTMVGAQNSVNSYNTSGTLIATPITPKIDYRMQGLDINVAIGKDLVHNGENDYVGLGIMVGLSTPWIDSSKNDSNNDVASDLAMNAMQSSKTEMLTYKVGPTITARKSLNNFFTIYGSGTYAYQTGSLTNDYINLDIDVDGIFQEYDVGIRFQPVSADFDLGLFTLSPRFYATIGYKYTSWDLDDISIDVTGAGTTFNQTDFNMNSSVAYFGLGYSF